MQNLTTSFPNQSGEPLDVTTAGWYYYQNQKVSGPANLREVQEIAAKNSQVVVTRRGFERWYSFSELQDFLRFREKLASETRPVVTPNLIQSTRARVQEQQPAFKVQTRPSVESTNTFASMLAAETVSMAQSLHPNTTRETTPSPLPTIQWRARLRLGRGESPFLCSFVFMPLTIGFFWYYWLRQRFVELVWHRDQHYDLAQTVPHLWLALLPGFHILYALKLCKLLNELELRSIGRAFTSRTWTFLFAIVPPLAVYYLQNRINRYWRARVLLAASGKT